MSETREWQPIKTAPKGETLFAWSENDGLFIGEYVHDGWLDDHDHPCAPTHWMPLPAPPDAALAVPKEGREP